MAILERIYSSIHMFCGMAECICWMRPMCMKFNRHWIKSDQRFVSSGVLSEWKFPMKLSELIVWYVIKTYDNVEHRSSVLFSVKTHAEVSVHRSVWSFSTSQMQPVVTIINLVLSWVRVLICCLQSCLPLEHTKNLVIHITMVMMPMFRFFRGMSL